MPSDTVFNEDLPQVEEQPGPLWQCNDLAESLNDESSDEEDDGNTCKICKISWGELTEKLRLGSMRYMQ